MPIPTPARPFGRRNLSAVSSLSTDYGVRNADTVRFPSPPVNETARSEAFLNFTASLAEERKKADGELRAHGPRVVPHSALTALLAGLVAACLHASLDIGSTMAFGRQFGITVDGQNATMTSVLILASLWSGARASIVGLIFVRFILAQLQTTHIAAYAACGGIVTSAYGYILHLHTPPNAETLILNAATGIAAGFFYRLFAGTKPVETVAA